MTKTATSDDPLVDATEALGHLNRLVDRGLNPTQIAQAAGVSRNAVVPLIDTDRRQVRASTAAAIVSVPVPRPTPPAPAEPWRARSACLGMDPQVFHPDLSSLAEIATAKAICATCSVTVPCLDVALRNREHGVWGGLTEPERGRLAERRRRR